MTPVVTGPVTELVTQPPVTELVTTTEEKLDEMVLQNGAINEIEEEEAIEESEEVTEVERIENEEIEPEEKDEEQHEEQKGTFEFNVPDIDDDSNGKKTLQKSVT